MGTQTEYIKFVFETQDKAGKDLKSLAKQFLTVAAAMMAVKKAGKFLLESTKLAARVETLGIVTETLGRNAGYTAQEIRGLEEAIQAQGITTQASRQALAKMMQAQLDLADSTELARLAQDAAVISGTNSSEAFQRLIDVISSGNVRMARTMGLQVNFNKGYKAMAKQLGKTTDELTSTEKAQSRVNTVLAEGEQIAGTYEAAMDTVGKQLESTARFWEEYKVAIGESNVELLGLVNTGIQEFLAANIKEIESQNLVTEALKMSGMEVMEWNKMLRTSGQTSLEWAEKFIHAAGNIESEAQRFAPNVIAEIEDIEEATEIATTSMKDWGKAAVGNMVIAELWNQALEGDNFITEEEKQAIERAGVVFGVELPADLDNMIALANSFGGDLELAVNDFSASMLEAVSEPYVLFVDIRTRGGGGMPFTSFDVPQSQVLSGSQGVGHARGANFTVPSGFPNDSFPMRVQSGEHVKVTPAGQSGNADVVAAINELKDEMYIINQELVAANS